MPTLSRPHKNGPKPAPSPAADGPLAGRRARRTAEIRERLFQAAVELFVTRGLHATTVKDITDRADVGKGTFFNYFPTKEHVVSLYYERQLWMMDAALRKAKQGDEPLQKTLGDLVRGTSQEGSHSEAMTRSFLLSILRDPAAAQMIAPLLRMRRNIMEQMWAIGQSRSEVRREWAPATIARIGQELAFGTALFWVLHPTESLIKLLDENLTLFLTSRTTPPERGAASTRRTRKSARVPSTIE